MATGINTSGLYDTSSIDLSGLLSQVLGTQQDKNTTADQKLTNNVTNTGNTATQNTGFTSTSGDTSNNTLNATNTVNNSRTGGQTNTTGTTNTTGSTNSTTSGTRNWNQTEQTSADIAGLQEILQRQLAGITPDMLASIFSEGSKAAPQLVTAQSNALGARTGTNTPVAAALNMLHGQLTSKAADVNLQMLRDAMTSAGQIGNLTKKVATSGSESSSSSTSSVTNQQVQSSTSQLFDQLTSGNTSSLSNTQSLGTNNSLVNNANTVNTQNNSTVNTVQDTHATDQSKVTTTVNKNIAAGLGSMVAAGVSINELFKLATGKGFLGTVQDFVKSLTDQGYNIPASSMTGITSSGVEPVYTNVDNTGLLPDINYADTVVNPLPGSEDVIDIFGPDYGFADGGIIKPELLIKQDDQQQQGGMTLAQLLAAVLSGGSSAQTMDGAVTGGAATAPASSVDPAKAVTSTREVTSGGDAQTTETVSNAKDGDVTPYYNPQQVGGDAGYTEQGPVAGYLRTAGYQGNSRVMDVYDSSGKFVNRELDSPDKFMQLVETVIPMLASAFMPGVGAVMAAGATDQAAQTGDTAGMLKGIIGMYTGAGKVGGGPVPGKADGGEIRDDGDGDDPMETMLASLGETKMPEGPQLSGEVLKRLYKVLTGEPDTDDATEGKANGGLIQGPGTGTSDSIPAAGPSGQPLQVSNGEYIIPADVVAAKGKHFFDYLVGQYHTQVN